MPQRTVRTQPRFSIVTAVYNVSRYLDDFFASLEAQSYGLKSLDIVLVDDGSTDDSLAKCEAFAAKWPTAVRVLHKENGGQSSARNLGIEHARGEWVMFADPDDMLDERYFDAVAHFAKRNQSADIALLSTPFIFFFERDGSYGSNHPLHYKFAQRNRVVDLRVEPEFIQMSASTAFFRTEIILRENLRFDERVRPTFEDALFVARYLVSAEAPKLGLIRSARYYYRKRADKSSTLDTSNTHPGKYTNVPKYGLLGALEYAQRMLGFVPMWLQYSVLYDLAGMFRLDSNMVSVTSGLPQEITAEYHEHLTQIFRHITPEAVSSFSILPISDDIRYVFAQGYSDAPAPARSVRLSEFDRDRGLALIRYRYAGAQPAEVFYVDGAIAQPMHQKTRAIQYFGRTLARERNVWVPLGHDIRVLLDGVPTPFESEIERSTYRVGDAHALERHRAVYNKRPERFRSPHQPLLPRAQSLLRREFDGTLLRTKGIALLLHSPFVRRAFTKAWVFMDRNDSAGDSAEALYKYVAAEHPEINSWFVVKKSSPDWKRLRREGVRTVAYGSLRWTLLMLSTIHLASSHADAYVLHPLDVKRFGTPRWRFTFLQHGVIKDDLSRWLNSKRIDLFVTTTRAEYASIVGDDTPYRFSSKEVVLTGLPRYDQLIAKRDAAPASERNLIVVMPTWRHNLVGPAKSSATDRSASSHFADSEYASQYTTLLASQRLHEIAVEHGCEIVFMPHPTMAPYLKEFAVPAGVRVLGYDEIDVQQVLARSSLLITDYSSMAFNSAMLDVPTVYFQFDREEFYSGAHTGRVGYYDYDADGFGPVCEKLDELESAVAELLTPGSALRALYSDRMQMTFPFHDTNNSARVFAAMRRINRTERPRGKKKATDSETAAVSALQPVR